MILVNLTLVIKENKISINIDMLLLLMIANLFIYKIKLEIRRLEKV